MPNNQKLGGTEPPLATSFGGVRRLGGSTSTGSWRTCNGGVRAGDSTPGTSKKRTNKKKQKKKNKNQPQSTTNNQQSTRRKKKKKKTTACFSPPFGRLVLHLGRQQVTHLLSEVPQRRVGPGRMEMDLMALPGQAAAPCQDDGEPTPGNVVKNVAKKRLLFHHLWQIVAKFWKKNDERFKSKFLQYLASFGFMFQGNEVGKWSKPGESVNVHPLWVVGSCRSEVSQETVNTKNPVGVTSPDIDSRSCPRESLTSFWSFLNSWSGHI